MDPTPPKPDASPAAYRPGRGLPSAVRTRPLRSVCSPPRVLRVVMCSLMAINGPDFGSSRRMGLETRTSPARTAGRCRSP